MATSSGRQGRTAKIVFTGSRLKVWILSLLVLCSTSLVTAELAVSTPETESLNWQSLYTDVETIDGQESLRRLLSLPIVHYQFQYDSVPGRVQIGSIGSVVQKLFPEAIEILPTSTFRLAPMSKSKTGSSSVQITNLPIVDKNILFYHGLAALQTLFRQFEVMNRTLHELSQVETKLESHLNIMEVHLEKEMSDQTRQLQEQKSKEILNQESLLALETYIDQEMKTRHTKQLSDELKLQQYEASLAEDRLTRLEMATTRQIEAQLDFERKLTTAREQRQRRVDVTVDNKKNELSEVIESRKFAIEKERIEAEMAAKRQAESSRHQAELAQLEAKASLETQRFKATIDLAIAQGAETIQHFAAHPLELVILITALLAIIGAIYGVREVAAALREIIQRSFGRPTLVRETSFESSWYQWMPWRLFNSKVSMDNRSSRAVLETAFEHIILRPEDKQRVIDLTLATQNTRSVHAPYRHVLLHGPPGTGKTLIARQLAISSGMDYAILSGGDVAPLGSEAVSQLHDLFHWASRSSRGLLVFIDEAEAFLSSRFGNSNSNTGNTGRILENGSSEMYMRNALNALLYQTGTPSQQFMLVLATNRPEDIDAAVLDRIDITLHIDLPAKEQRLDMVQWYMNSYLRNTVKESHERVEAAKKSFLRRSTPVAFMVEESCYDAAEEIAKDTEGFSGREIAKIFIGAQYAMYLASDHCLTLNALRDVVKTKLMEHSSKLSGFTTTHSNHLSLSKDNTHRIPQTPHSATSRTPPPHTPSTAPYSVRRATSLAAEVAALTAESERLLTPLRSSRVDPLTPGPQTRSRYR